MILFVQEMITKDNNNMIREKRDSRLTADISETAHELLRSAVIKFDSSKGKLVEKMIFNFLGDAEAVTPDKPKTQIAVVKEAAKKANSKFNPPTFAEVDMYMIERGVHDQSEAASFCDFYESKGWVVGKVKMKSWKAAVRNWLKNYKTKTKGSDILQLSADSNWEDGINEIF